jgi:sporulation protein YlmC with PRC-barrel domain
MIKAVALFARQHRGRWSLTPVDLEALMFFQRVKTPGIAHNAYIIAHDRLAVALSHLRGNSGHRMIVDRAARRGISPAGERALPQHKVCSPMKLLLVGLAALLLIAPAAAQDRKPPLPDMATGNTTDRPPRQPVVAEKPDQILARNVIGQPLYGRNDERLGHVTDGLVDRTRNSLDVLLVDIETGKNPLRAVAWSSVDATDRKHVSADLSKDELQSASPIGTEVMYAPDLLSATDRLFGHDVVDRNGTPVGKLHDVVVDMKDGQLVAALVDPGTGLGTGTKGAPHAVPWSVVTLSADKDQPLRLGLTKDEFDSEPAFVSMAPAAPTRSVPLSGKAEDPSRPPTIGPVDRVPPPSPPSTRRTD